METSRAIPQSELVFARLGKELSAIANAAAAAEVILSAAQELIGWDAGYLILYDPQQGGTPRPLLAIDTIDNQKVVQHNVFPDKPTENMLAAIRENGFMSLYEEQFYVDPSLSFGDHSRRTLSQLFAPVRSGERTLGVLSIQSYQIHAYTENSLESLKALANHCAGALERIWAQEALIQLADRLKILYQAAHAINASLDMNQVCDAIQRSVEGLMPCDDFVIDGYDEQTNEIIPIYAIEYPRRRIFTEKYFADHGMAGRIIHTQMPLLLNSAGDIENSGIDFELFGSAPTDSTQSILAVPLLLHGRVVGMISAQSYKQNAYTIEDQYLLELLATHAAIAIENASLFAKTQQMADMDFLTEIFSRRKFFELAEREFNRAKRDKKELSAIVLDVDEFKKFNDTFGHKAGDRVLKLIATQCNSSLRNVDIFGRLGGEEFVAILPDTKLEHAVLAANRLRQVVEEANLTQAENLLDLAASDGSKKEALKVTVSVGIATCDESCKNIDILIDYADRAMYSAKQAGRNQVSIWKNSED